MRELKKKTAVITGAASGIGRATALAMAEAGCHLALVDVNREELAQTKLKLQRETTRHGTTARTYEVDVSDAEEMHALADQIADDFGDIHIIVNNAGINVTASFEDHTLDDFRRVLDVNLRGVIHGCHFFLPYLKKVDQAHIVNISSAFGIVGVAGQSAYSASKFAVRGLSESLHEEFANSSIGVSVVHPGCIKTNIVRDAIISDADAADGIRDYFVQKGAAPQVVARRIVRAIRNNEHRVLVTPETYLLDFLRRAIPERGNRIANRIMARMLGLELPYS